MCQLGLITRADANEVDLNRHKLAILTQVTFLVD